MLLKSILVIAMLASEHAPMQFQVRPGQMKMDDGTTADYFLPMVPFGLAVIQIEGEHSREAHYFVSCKPELVYETFKGPQGQTVSVETTQLRCSNGTVWRIVGLDFPK